MTRSWVEVPLTKGKVAKIDRADMLIIGGFRWQAYKAKTGTWYCCRSAYPDGKKHTVRMHRWIMQPGSGLVVDHINGDGLDNRRANLRICTHQQNITNHVRPPRARSGLRGASQFGGRGRWQARIRHNEKIIHLGAFDTAEEAARAYDRAAHSLRGKFATLNFPDEAPPDAAL